MKLTEDSNFDGIWARVIEITKERNEFLTIGERRIQTFGKNRKK